MLIPDLIRDRYIEPMLQEMDAQHAFQSNRADGRFLLSRNRRINQGFPGPHFSPPIYCDDVMPYPE